MGQRGATRAPGALVARPPPRPRQEAAWVGPTPSGALPWLLFLPVTEKSQIRSPFANSRRGAAATSVLLRES
jgi:hypothetical protein